MKSQKLKVNSFIFSWFYCFIVLLLIFSVVSPVYAQGVDIGEWFGGERECKRWSGGSADPNRVCVEWGWKETGIRELFPEFSSFGAFVSSVLPNVYTIAGVILVFLLIFGGFTYIVNAGKQDTEGIQKGKKAITAALVGFGLIFGSWWIIQIVEVITGIDILK